MVAPSPDLTPEGWDLAAEKYDEKILPFTRQYAADAWRLSGARPGSRVLDVAAGSGALTLLAARAGARVTATDVAPRMVERLRARLAAEKLTAEVARMDGQALDLPDAAFDAAFSVFGIMFFPDRAAGFRELHRVLKPKGRAAVATWSRPDRAPFLTVVRRAAQQVAPDLPAPQGTPPVFILQDPEQLASEMRAAGFHDVRVESVTHTWDVPRPEDFFDSVNGTSPVFAPLLQQVGAHRQDALREALAGILRAEYGDGPVRLPAEAHVAVGTR